MSDKVLVTTESIQKQLPIKRSSQQRGVQIFRETLILKASTQNLPPPPPPIDEKYWENIHETSNTRKRPQYIQSREIHRCAIVFDIFFWADYKKWGKKVLNCTHIPSALRKCREVDEKRLRAYIKNTLIICYLDEKGDCKRYYHFQFVNFSLDWINLFFVI